VRKDNTAPLAASLLQGIAYYRMKAGRFAHALKKSAFFQ